jgi:hypothetical protein
LGRWVQFWILFFPCVIENSVKGVFKNLEVIFWQKKITLIICSEIFIVQLPKCLGVGCAA